MDIVICTGTGIFFLAICAAILVGVVYVLGWLGDRAYPFPNWVNRVGTVLLCTMAVIAVLIMGHEIGCKIIHLTHG